MENHKKHAREHKSGASKDLLKEEFGSEMGDFNATKAYEGAIVAKANKKQSKK